MPELTTLGLCHLFFGGRVGACFMVAHVNPFRACSCAVSWVCCCCFPQFVAVSLTMIVEVFARCGDESFCKRVEIVAPREFICV